MEQVRNPIMKLGITGGIGSGKTSVCKVFNVLGIPVFSADTEARKIMTGNRRIIEGINEIAGRNIYPSGILDSSSLAALIFNNQEALDRVNRLVHPEVFLAFEQWITFQEAPYVIMEAAILFESGAESRVDRVATVVAPVEERIERVTRRNLLSREQVEERIRNQMDDETRIQRSDYIIYNSENDMIIPEILRIHDDILNHLSN